METDRMHQADSEGEMLALPVRWRAFLLTVAYLVLVLQVVGMGQTVIARLFHGGAASGGYAFAPWLVCGLVAGIIAGLIGLRRDRKPVRLTATDLEVPRFWRGGTGRLPRHEVDVGASVRHGRLDALLRRDVIRSRTGDSLSIYRWSYSARDVRRIEAALGIPVHTGQGA
jgi:hypothetical protein